MHCRLHVSVPMTAIRQRVPFQSIDGPQSLAARSIGVACQAVRSWRSITTRVVSIAAIATSAANESKAAKTLPTGDARSA